MRSSFSKLLLVGSLIFAAGCGLRNEPEVRLPTPHFQNLPLPASFPAKKGEPLFDNLFETSVRVGACEWLNRIEEPKTLDAKFQLLGQAEVKILKAGNGAGDRYLLDITGSIDSGGSPLYSYALLSQSIPSREEFLGLVRQEIQKTPGFPLKLHLGEWLMKSGLLDPFKQRNLIIEERINEALPGIFAASDDRLFKIKDSIPWMILRNGSPELGSIGLDTSGSGEPADPLARLRQEQEMYEKVLKGYSQASSIFSDTSWYSVAEDVRLGLHTAIGAFKTKNPLEKACATSILHRMLSQLFTVIGYDRLPFEVRNNADGFHLPPISEILDPAEKTRFMVCPTAGSFIKDGSHVIMDRDLIAGFNPEAGLYDLSATPVPLKVCDKSKAIPYSLDIHQNFKGEAAESLAKGRDWLSFINALTNFLTTFNPGAPWWQDPDNTVGFPMAPFESLERIKSSGAILPVDANALSLGLLNISMATFLQKHLLFLDANNRVTLDLTRAVKIRIREDLGDLPVITRIDSAILLAETAFKLAETLRLLEGWRIRAEAMVQEDAAREKDFKKRLKILRDYNAFLEGMFGSADVLDGLLTSADGSLRQNLESLKLASALLVADFAKKNTSHGYDCYADLELDPVQNLEAKKGSCTPSERRLWKYALSLMAREYRSPQFTELSAQ